MNQFINERDTVVTESIDGMLRSSDVSLARLDGYPHIKVVVRSDWNKSRVALISGGGSGHEPSHAKFVGKGMLTAAVCGEVFASPSVESILAAILAVSGHHGCLLIVKSYTGDRLNFSLAMQRARALGVKVKMAVVEDDYGVSDVELDHRRGVAGTLIVHKIAGAAAASGKDLDYVAAVANRVAGAVCTVGMSLDTCTVPGSVKEDRIAAGMAEFGIGIHGEPGIEQVPFSTAESAVKQVTDRLLRWAPDGNLVALVNNLGGCTPLEMGILTNNLIDSNVGKRIKHIIGPAPIMTSLDMRGFSISLFAPTRDDRAGLAAPVAPTAWPGCVKVNKVMKLPLPKGLHPKRDLPSEDFSTRFVIERCCRVLIESENALNELDAKSGDGDTGSTLATAARVLIAKLDDLPLAVPAKYFRALSYELSESVGGTLGVLMSIFFAAANEALALGGTLDQSLARGLDRIKQVGGAKVGDRTLIDALEPALKVLCDGIERSAAEARRGADATALIEHAGVGRAQYVSGERFAGHNDPGAEAVALLFECVAEVSHSLASMNKETD